MSQQVRLGGFVVHRNNRDTLERCIRSLQAVCHEVVAVDSGATDGSRELAQALGARSVTHRWEGYGGARALAARTLGPCDYIFFLDSDEWLETEAVERIRAWKASGSTVQALKLPVHDWAELEGGRFLYRRHWRVRLFRRDAAGWTRQMIVHEGVPGLATRRLHAPIEHRFATERSLRSAKEDRYALLWALRAWGERRKTKPVGLQRLVHVLKDTLIQGALFRGGMEGVRMAWAVSRYHAAEYAYLKALRAGAYPELRAALTEGRYADLFESPLPLGEGQGEGHASR